MSGARLCCWGASGGCAALLLGVTGVAHVVWGKRVAGRVTRVGLLFARGELAYCYCTRMLVVKCRWRSCVGVCDEIGVGVR